MVQLSPSYMTTGKTIALTLPTFIGRMFLLFNTLSRFVLPRSRKPLFYHCPCLGIWDCPTNPQKIWSTYILSSVYTLDVSSSLLLTSVKWGGYSLENDDNNKIGSSICTVLYCIPSAFITFLSHHFSWCPCVTYGVGWWHPLPFLFLFFPLPFLTVVEQAQRAWAVTQMIPSEIQRGLVTRLSKAAHHEFQLVYNSQAVKQGRKINACVWTEGSLIYFHALHYCLGVVHGLEFSSGLLVWFPLHHLPWVTPN